PVAAAALGQLVAKLLQIRLVDRPEVAGVDELPAPFDLQAVEARAIVERELQLVPVPDLEDQDLVPRVAEVGQGRQKTRDVPEAVREDDEEAAAVDPRDQVVEDLGQLGLAPRGRGLEL